MITEPALGRVERAVVPDPAIKGATPVCGISSCYNRSKQNTISRECKYGSNSVNIPHGIIKPLKQFHATNYIASKITENKMVKSLQLEKKYRELSETDFLFYLCLLFFVVILCITKCVFPPTFCFNALSHRVIEQHCPKLKTAFLVFRAMLPVSHSLK